MLTVLLLLNFLRATVEAVFRHLHERMRIMMMSRERLRKELVTNFFLSTCRQHPPLGKYTVQAIVWCGATATQHPDSDAEVDLIPLVTGSVAEFYIEPMLPFVGDIDMMYHRSNELATPRGHPPPTQLPAEFDNCVRLHEIIKSGFPGYVYMKLSYLPPGCICNDSLYIENKNEKYLSNRIHDDGEMNKLICHGPAIFTDTPAIILLPSDGVRCVRCLSWPPQATNWPTRHRNYDWPDSATVDRVVSNGCDLVGVAHRQCRQDEWMSKAQWRLSFSRAEVVLLNSWMPVQQILYHVLRFFAKTELLADDNSETCTLSNYHIKTLMMWACEVRSGSFWGNEFVCLCMEQLHTLSVWLTDASCPHYFIDNCNLIDCYSIMEITASQLNSVDEPWLLTWLINSYIQKCSLLCPDKVSSLFSDVSTNMKLHNAVIAVVDWRLNPTLEDTWNRFFQAQALITGAISQYPLTVRSCIYWTTELAKTDTRLLVRFTADAFLHVAYRMSRTGFTDELMDVLLTLTRQSVSTRRPNKCNSELSLSKATKLMKVVANSSHSTMQLIEIELSKAYLCRALKCKDSDSNSIYCLANVYLAVLYYTTGQYQMAIDHCTLVTRSQDHLRCSSHVIEGELLPKIDDDIDSVLGLAVFYQYVRTAALNQRQTVHVHVLTTQLFGHYLNIRCLSVRHSLLSDEVYQLIDYISKSKLLIADVLAVKSVIHHLHCQPMSHSRQQPAVSAADLNKLELVELLQKSAVKHLTTYRQLEAQDFGSVATIVTTDFEVLYAYKHGDYQRCLHLSALNVCTLLKPVQMSGMVIYPEFIQLLDDDIVSLIGLMQIVNPDCRFQGINVVVTQLTLSLYLMTQCQLKLRQSLRALAQTLDYFEDALTMVMKTIKPMDKLILKLAKRKLLMYSK